MKLVYDFLENLSINKNDNIIVAVSFGPDSMMLLDVIRNYYNQNNIICAHVHHNHRKESDEEALLLEKYCNENDIKFEMMKINTYKNDRFTEEEARNKRYEFFDLLMNKYNSKYLFTAHHGDDLIETILMRLTRGSSLKGYSGINLISNRNDYSLLRPLLFLTKEDIIKYCNENKISYAVDKSNLDDDYTRNRYRNHVLPILKKENNDVHKQFLKFSTVLQEHENFFRNITNKLYNKVVYNSYINLDILLKEDKLLVKRIIMKYLNEHYKEKITLINDKHLDLILRLIKNTKINDFISLPDKKILVKSYNKLYFDNEMNYNDYCFLLDNRVNLPNGYTIEITDTLDNTTNFFTAFNKKDISFPLFIRTRKDGDKIEVLNMDGAKKLKDIFIDEKIDIVKRKTYPILTDNNGNILWIPGLKKSKYDRSKKGNYDIILKYYKEEENDSTS